MSLRIGGLAAVIAASTWTGLLLAIGSGQGQPFGGAVAVLAFAGLLALLLAVAGLSAYQAAGESQTRVDGLRLDGGGKRCDGDRCRRRSG